MTIISISTFRKDMAKYLRLVQYKGERIRIVDGKMKHVVGDIIPSQSAEDEHLQFVKNMYGSLRGAEKDIQRSKIKKVGIDKLKRLRKA